MKYEIAYLANQLCSLLEFCDDEEFINMICSAVANNERIDLDEIEDDEDD